MTTSPSKPKAFALETIYVWGESLPEAMNYAISMEKFGWRIQGNPAPMFFDGKFGTGVSISRIKNADG